MKRERDTMIINSGISNLREQNYSKKMGSSINSMSQFKNNMTDQFNSSNKFKNRSQVSFGFIDPGTAWEILRNVIEYAAARKVVDIATKGVKKIFNFAKGLFGYGPKLGTDATDRAGKVAKDVSGYIEEKIEKIVEKNPHQTIDNVMDIYGQKLERVIIPLKGDGYEQGLNKVMGLQKLKTSLYNDVLMPLCETMDGKPKHYFVPNGISFFGPRGTGKSYFAEQLGDHYMKKGGYFEKMAFSNDSKQDIETLDKLFANAEQKYNESGKTKYTMILFDEIEKYLDKNNVAQKPTIARLLELSNNCKNKGVIMLSTSNSLDKAEPALLRTGRTDLRIPIGHVADYDLAAIINYYLKADGLPHTHEKIDFQHIIDAVKTEKLEYKPYDIESRLVREADNCSDYGGELTTESIKDALLQSKPEFNEVEHIQFDTDKLYAKQLGGIYEY